MTDRSSRFRIPRAIGRPFSRRRLRYLLRLPALALSLGAASSGGDRPTDIPFRLIDNLVFVEGSVDDHPANVVIDSGTGGIVVDRGFASTIGLLEGRVLGNADGAGAKPAPLHRTLLKSISVDDVRHGPVSAYTLDTTPFSQSSGAPVNALFGYEFFRDHYIQVDYTRSQIRVYKTDGALASCLKPLRFVFLKGVPVVIGKVSFDDGVTFQQYRLVVDLGTRHHSILLGRSFLASAAGMSLMQKAQPTRIGVGTGGSAFGWTSNASILQVGTQQFRHVDVAATKDLDQAKSLPVDGTLGVPLWKSGSIDFDYEHATICIRPSIG